MLAVLAGGWKWLGEIRILAFEFDCLKRSDKSKTMLLQHMIGFDLLVDSSVPIHVNNLSFP